MKKFLFILFLTSAAFVASAQVGINTMNPDEFTALEIEGGGSKGLLIPVMSEGDRTRMEGYSLKTGLLVCDTTDGMFYYWRESEWVALNPLQSTSNENRIFLSSRDDTIIFTNKVAVADLVGQTKLNGSLNVTGIIDVDSIHVNKGITAQHIIIEETAKAKNAEIEETVTAGEFVGAGTIPLGGIIMWSGTQNNIPDGWALCNGQSSNGFTTPDLRGRFVVGYGASGSGLLSTVWDSNYSNPGNLSEGGTIAGNSGGAKEVKLEVTHLPPHSHPIANITRADGGGTQTGRRDWHEDREGTEINSGSTGGGTAHENRPPYYVLAFIMRVK